MFDTLQAARPSLTVEQRVWQPATSFIDEHTLGDMLYVFCWHGEVLLFGVGWGCSMNE